ncbi:MAG: PaaI family thioesterase [Burkholderiales bacterium]|nr:PaaI family thioesterase [Burkholderiales bacterium]
MDDDAYFWQVMAGRRPPPPAAATLGLRVREVDAEAGRITLDFEASPSFTNPVGHVQGGFLAAMLDDTLGPALAAQLARGEWAPTLNLTVSFHRPARPGPLQGVGRVLRRSSEVAFLAGELYQQGELVASATATALVRAKA